MSDYRDDSWRDTYDAWKLATPPEYDGPVDEPECDHICFEVNWEGRAECEDCGHTWWATTAQVMAYDAAQRGYEASWQRENSWYMRAWRWVKSLRRPKKAPVDDDIPF